jgi:hypothetical protein
MHNRQVLLLIIVAILLLAGPLAGRTKKLTEEVWTLELVADCALDYHASGRALALACPGVDYVRLWPLPVIQPWEEPQEPSRLQHGQMATVGTWILLPTPVCSTIAARSWSTASSQPSPQFIEEDGWKTHGRHSAQESSWRVSAFAFCGTGCSLLPQCAAQPPRCWARIIPSEPCRFLFSGSLAGAHTTICQNPVWRRRERGVQQAGQ